MVGLELDKNDIREPFWSARKFCVPCQGVKVKVR